jgi:hypothetical protein
LRAPCLMTSPQPQQPSCASRPGFDAEALDLPPGTNCLHPPNFGRGAFIVSAQRNLICAQNRLDNP